MARIIAVASGKGGVGKTTVALNLATILAHRFKRNVTLIDCNVTTSHLGMYLGMYYSPITLNKVLRGEVSMKEAVYHHVGGLKVIPASLSISDLDGVDVTKLRENIDLIADENEIILLDVAPGLGREAIASLKAADEVMFVTTPYVPSVMDIIRNMEVVNEIGLRPIGIVLNMVDKEKYEMSPQEVEQLTRLPVIASIPFDKAVHKSLVEKLPVVLFKQDSKVAKAFTKLGADLIGIPYEEKRSIFSRIMRKLRGKKKIEMPSALLTPDLQSMSLEDTRFEKQRPESRVFSEQKISLPDARPEVQSDVLTRVQPEESEPEQSETTLVPVSSLDRPGFPKPDVTRPERPKPKSSSSEPTSEKQ